MCCQQKRSSSLVLPPSEDGQYPVLDMDNREPHTPMGCKVLQPLQKTVWELPKTLDRVTM